jgi:hypothetical protein
VTDARLPERWLNDRRLLRLPDDAFRLFVTSLMWSVANKTDGVLYDDDLPLIPSANPSLAGQLAKAGLWKREWDRWLIVEFEETQTTRADLEALARGRRAQRDKKRRQRATKAARASSVPGDVPGDTPRTGQDRTGKAPRNVVPGKERAEVEDSLDGSAPKATTQGGPGGRRVPPGTVAGSSPANEPAPPQTRKRVHDGPEPDGPDVQHFSIDGSAGAQLQTVTREAAGHLNGSAPRRWPESKTKRQEIIRLGAEGLTYRQIAAKTGKSPATISGILRRRTARP